MNSVIGGFPQRGAEWAVIVALVLLAAALRLYNLAEQSVWYDEYVTIGQLTEEGLIPSIQAQRKWDWHMVPVYHTLQYFWWRLFGQSDLAVRCLSVLFGLAAVPILYFLGRALSGPWTGFTAALLLALSPLHIFHAQAIRNYSLLLFLGLLCAWTCWNMVRTEGRRWWIANFLANALLIWTHILAVFAFAPQGLYLLLFHRRPWRRFALWTGLHIALLIPLLLWMTTIHGGVGSPTTDPPALDAIPRALFAHDPGQLTWMDYIVPKDIEPPDLPALGVWLIKLREQWGFESIRMRAAAFLAIAYGVLAGLLAGFLLWRRRNGRGGEAAAVRLEPASFAVFWWLIPVLLLYGLTLATRLSLFHDRFVIYALPALYLLVGMAVTSMPWPPLRALTVAALAGLLAVQTVTYAVVPVRQGYLQAARHIEAHADAGDPVIRHLYYTQILLEYSLDHTGLVLRESNSYDELLQKTVAQVENQGDVWVVLLSQPELTGGPPEREGLAQRFAEDLRQRGIPFDRQRYVGMQNLYVFHCRPADTPPNQSGGANVPTSKRPGERERPRAPAHASRRRNRRKN